MEGHLKRQRQVVEIEKRKIRRQIVRHNPETKESEHVQEEEDISLFRAITDTAEFILKDFIRRHLDKMADLPQIRMERVQDPMWFPTMFATQRESLYQDIQYDEGLSDLYSNPLLTTYRMDKVVFQHHNLLETKLMLRDHKEYVEYPELKMVTKIEEDLELPEGVSINQEARGGGFYRIDAEDYALLDRSKKYFIYATFDIGDGVLIKRKFPLDFIFSCVPYGPLVQSAYRLLVVNPAIEATNKLIQKHYPRLLATTRQLYNESDRSISKTPTDMLLTLLPSTSKLR